MDIDLALITGIDIPIPECQLILHQPTIKEISMIGEMNYFYGMQCLCVTKDMCMDLPEEEKANIKNFYLLINIISNPQTVDKRKQVVMTLELLFPGSKINITPRTLLINLDGKNFIIDEDNFDFFQAVLKKVFDLGQGEQINYNPGNDEARRIVEKIMRGRKRVAAAKQTEQEQHSLLSQYVSVLAVGMNSMSIEDLINLTVYQLIDLVERYNMWLAWDLDIKARLAGGKPEKEVDDWRKPIH